MGVQELFEEMKSRLGRVVPEFELKQKAELVHEIRRLKRERNAIILGHNYMEPALFHFVPDFRGDSLELSRRAANVEEDIIVFCGVRFMAETAKILSPDKQVLLPAREAGCSLAASIDVEGLRRLKAQYPGAPVVSYVNTYAEIKAESDICCTSGNAARVVESLDSEQIIFVPDEYLARNVARETGREILVPARGESDRTPSKRPRLIGWPGRCEVHEKFTVEDIASVRKQFPEASILAHPECSPEVVLASDYSGSTAGMIRHVEQSDAPSYLLLTECAMGDNVAAANPDKEMLRMCSVRCPHMNAITLEDTLDALRNLRYEIEVAEAIRVPAARAIERMLAVS